MLRCPSKSLLTEITVIHHGPVRSEYGPTPPARVNAFRGGLPFRIGVVFVVSDADDVDGMDDAGVALLRAFNYIADDVDSQHALDAIISVRRIFPPPAVHPPVS